MLAAALGAPKPVARQTDGSAVGMKQTFRASMASRAKMHHGRLAIRRAHQRYRAVDRAARLICEDPSLEHVFAHFRGSLVDVHRCVDVRSIRKYWMMAVGDKVRTSPRRPR